MDVAPELGLEQPLPNGRPDVKNYILEVNGNGAAFVDYDVDGNADLLFTRGSSLERLAAGGDPLAILYRQGDDAFRDVTGVAHMNARGWGVGVCAGDYDDDGYVDLYLTAYGANALYRNLGDGTFTEVGGPAGVADRRWGSNCAFGDYDRDGDADLYVTNYLVFDPAEVPRRGESDDCRYLGVRVFCGPAGLEPERDALYRNEGDGSFEDVTAASGIAGEPHTGFGVVFSDLDDDGWPDLYVANDAMPNQLFHNRRDGTFQEAGLLSGLAFSAQGRAQSGMGLAVEDYDNDGRFDAFVTNFSRDTNTLYRNQGDLFFLPMTEQSGAARESFTNLGWGTGLVDLDNDGWRDLFVANGHVYPEIAELDPRSTYRQPKELYRNLRDGTFEAVTGRSGPDLRTPWSSRGVAFGDLDDDGDLDVAVANIDDRPSLYRNETRGAGDWIRFRLVDDRGNRAALGARVEVRTGERTQVTEVRSGGSYLSHHDLRPHFGLGSASRVETVRIRWPDGALERFGPFEAGSEILLRRGSGSAAPEERQPVEE